MLLFSKIIMMKSHFLLRSFLVQSEFPFVQLSLQSNTFSPSTVTSSDFFSVKSSTSSSFFESVVHYHHYYIMRTTEISKRYYTQYVRTAVCRIIKGFAFYSSKRPILRVIGGAEGVVPHPHNGGSK